MANTGFTRKKVESMTLGEKLRKIRSEYRVSLSEVSKHTKIRMQYLEYLENGEYEKLPAEVYVRGFVRSYANFLGTDESVLVKLYERENNIQRNLKKDQFQDEQKVTFQSHRFIVTPRIFFTGMVIASVVAGCFYLYREFQSFASVPRLIVFEPLDGQTVEGNEVDVRGISEQGASVTINGQPVLVADDGNFHEHVRLQSGANMFTVVASNRFKKEKRAVFSVQTQYDFSSENASGKNESVIASTPAKTKFEVFVREKALNVSVKVDGNEVYNGVLTPEKSQIFDVEKEMKVSSEDGSKTLVRSGESTAFRAISILPGDVKDVVFLTDSD